ncbi:hypothetical protein VARIO8X_110102 [Burkholderiales bacterium 8X]|nr:hypothetical protein VARIO8X_110102 [Burkholderiales bacterium 8X]
MSAFQGIFTDHLTARETPCVRFRGFVALLPHARHNNEHQKRRQQESSEEPAYAATMLCIGNNAYYDGSKDPEDDVFHELSSAVSLKHRSYALASSLACRPVVKLYAS